MYINDTLKKNIEEEFNDFKDYMYGDNTIGKRKNLDQFFTPANFTLETLKNYKDDSVTSLEDADILDPCCGSGCLLASCIIAGADPKRVYGNDYDGDMVELCRKHLVEVSLKYMSSKYNYTKEELEEIFKYHIHRGNALQKKCLTNFDDNDGELYLKGKSHYQDKYIDDLLYAQSDARWETQNHEAKTRLERQQDTANEQSKEEATKKVTDAINTTTVQEVKEFKVEVTEPVATVKIGPKVDNRTAVEDDTKQIGLFN